MTRHIPAVVAALAILPITPATGQTCTDPHYRWTVKTTVAHQGDPATAATPSAITWTPLEVFHPAPGAHDCTPRADRELTQGPKTKSSRSDSALWEIHPVYAVRHP